ncbi:MAG: hypothetical protein JRC93_12780, partial [Deltaproteobacteria bacterium]|nr:hypothetical protein [Deltaproteobacteria bacterium]
QEEWVNYKGAIFSILPHNFYSYPVSYRFTTMRHPLWAEHRSMWYADDHSRILPREFVQQHFTDLTLAVWFLDDGSCHQREAHHRPFADLAPNAYSQAAVEFLARLLCARGIECKAVSQYQKARDRTYWSIRVSATGFAVMRSAIAKFVPPSMRYKLGSYQAETLDPFDATLYQPNSTDPVYWAPVAVTEVGGRPYRNKNGEWRVRPENYLYTITVDETHSFVTTGGVVSNSNLEVSIWGHYSQDKNLLSILSDPDQDYHSVTAAICFEVPVEQVTKEQRSASKVITFGGIMYGGDEWIVAKMLDKHPDECRELMRRLFAEYPQGQRWLESQVITGHRQGYVQSTIGRRRRVPELQSDDERTVRQAERFLKNAPIQGLASDINNLSLLRMEAWVRENHVHAWPLNMVHDSIIYEIEEQELDRVDPVLRALMVAEPFTGFGVPLSIDVKVSRHWGGDLDVQKAVEV